MSKTLTYGFIIWDLLLSSPLWMNRISNTGCFFCLMQTSEIQPRFLHWSSPLLKVSYCDRPVCVSASCDDNVSFKQHLKLVKIDETCWMYSLIGSISKLSKKFNYMPNSCYHGSKIEIKLFLPETKNAKPVKSV